MAFYKRENILKGIVPIILVSMIALTGCANSNKDSRGNKKQGPPPEAIKACNGKQVGDSVSFSGRGGNSVTGTCQTINGQLVAVPEGHRQ